MSTAYQEFKDGIYQVSWVNQSYAHNATVDVEIIEIDTLCRLTYNVDNKSHTTLTVKLMPIPGIPNPILVQPVTVLANKFGVQKSMQYVNQQWTTKFESSYLCCGNRGLIFDICIDTVPKEMVLVTKKAKCVIGQLLELWLTKTLADITFVLQSTRIEAHSQIIASGSPVLAAMFQSQFKEGADRVAFIEDVRPLVFEKLLRFIYTGDAEIDRATAEDLLVAANKYAVESLREECGLYLSQLLSVENAINFLVFSHLHNSENLYKATLNFMAKNGKSICSRKEWLAVIKEYPELSFAAMQLMAMG